jgi:hypothetical protein
MALIANCHRDPKKSRALKPSDFDPYAVKDKRPEGIEVKDMALLKDAFMGQAAGEGFAATPVGGVSPACQDFTWRKGEARYNTWGSDLRSG